LAPGHLVCRQSALIHDLGLPTLGIATTYAHYTVRVGSLGDLIDVRSRAVGFGSASVRFHDLRHSSASLLLAQGIPARVVMDRLGHSNIALTLGTYSHVIPQLHQEAADAIDRVLGGQAFLDGADRSTITAV